VAVVVSLPANQPASAGGAALAGSVPLPERNPTEPPRDYPELLVEPPEPVIAATQGPATAGLPALPPVANLPPVAAPVPRAEPVPARNVLGHLQKLGEEDLRKQLERVPEVSLDRVPGTTRVVIDNGRLLLGGNVPFIGPLRNLPGHRPDLLGLPMLLGQESQLGLEPAQNLHALSGQLRALARQAIVEVARAPAGAGLTQTGRLLELLHASDAWKNPDAIPTLMQMLTAETPPVRKVLVEFLAQIPGPRATAALAMRAVTDLSADVRRVAVDALRAREAADYRGVLLAGLCYPIPAIAQQAAEALVTLDERASLPILVKLLDQPTPTPTQRVREVVKINHIRNCVLCHPPSFQPTDLVRGVVPGSSVVVATYSGGTAQDDFIRADVTFLRQDFSVLQPVRVGQRPTMQRFDYLVRLRKPTEQELAGQQPAREAVLFALRELTAKDPGKASQDWEPVVRAMTNPATIEEVAKNADRDWRQFITTLLP
jgi:hypothetical protein